MTVRRFYPQYTEKSKDHFVDKDTIAPWSVTIGDSSILTAALKTKHELTILRIAPSHGEEFDHMEYVGINKIFVEFVSGLDKLIVGLDVEGWVFDMPFKDDGPIVINQRLTFQHPTQYKGFDIFYDVDVVGEINLEKSTITVDGSVRVSSAVENPPTRKLRRFTFDNVTAQQGPATVIGYGLEMMKLPKEKAFPNALYVDAVPVHCETTKVHFVDDKVIAPTDFITESGNTYKTSYLLFGDKIDLLSITCDKKMIANGDVDYTDVLGPEASLLGLLLCFTRTSGATEVQEVDVSRHPLNSFVYAVKDNYRVLTCNAEFPFRKRVGDTMLRYYLKIAGSLNLETGTLELNAKAEFIAATNAITGNPDDNAISTDWFHAVVGEAKLIGYKLKAKRGNLNRQPR